MLLDALIGACAALAAAGILLLAFKIMRRKAPRNLVLAVAAIAIIGVTATLRYQWADNTAAMLPDDMVVIERLTFSNPIEPWSLVKPVTDRLIVVDQASVRRPPAFTDMVLVDVLLVRRDGDTMVARHLVDCPQRRDAVVPQNTTLADGTLPEDLEWASNAPQGLYTAACDAGN